MKYLIMLCFISIITIGVIFMGCDKGTESEEGTLIGKWEAVKEVASLEEGDITITPQSPLFTHLIIEVNEDSTVEYEMWTGPDKEAEDAGYETGTGTWAVTGTIFSLRFADAESTVYEGTYKVKPNKLIINITMAVEAFGGQVLPIKVTFNRIR